ncbi:MAG: hypothetical protein QM295_06335 [Bacillota bacterium]|jgi:hypothetical protein|nr:hypothetical protein [Bacillota bacterium]
MTYTVCKKLIEIKEFTQDEADDLQCKLDVFLLNDRIMQEEYEELTGMLVYKINGN